MRCIEINTYLDWLLPLWRLNLRVISQRKMSQMQIQQSSEADIRLDRDEANAVMAPLHSLQIFKLVIFNLIT